MFEFLFEFFRQRTLRGDDMQESLPEEQPLFRPCAKRGCKQERYSDFFLCKTHAEEILKLQNLEFSDTGTHDTTSTRI